MWRSLPGRRSGTAFIVAGRCDLDYDDYICHNCRAIRPFVGGTATMRQCTVCQQMSLALACFCEWCGAEFDPPAGRK